MGQRKREGEPKRGGDRGNERERERGGGVHIITVHIHKTLSITSMHKYG